MSDMGMAHENMKTSFVWIQTNPYDFFSTLLMGEYISGEALSLV